MKKKACSPKALAFVLVYVVALAGAALATDYEPTLPIPPTGCYTCPRISVSPSDGLVDGQSVGVTGINFGTDVATKDPVTQIIQGGSGGTLRQCTAALNLCESATVSFTTGKNGAINPIGAPSSPNDPVSQPVSFAVKLNFTASNGTPVNCVSSLCVIFAVRHSTDAPFEDKTATHHLSFLPVGRYTPLTPARILDTRVGIGGISSPIGSGASVDIQVSGQGGVPASGVTAVVMNVTVTQPTSGGFLTISPTGTARPNASNLNFTPGETIPNLVVVKLGTGGRVNLFNSAGSTHVIFDVSGWFSDNPVGASGRYNPLVPARILDTRVGPGAGLTLGPGASMDLAVAGQGGVPASGAAAAVLNVAVTNTTGSGFLTIYPAGQPRPNASNLNWQPGDTVSNRVKATLGVGGKVTIFNSAGSADIIVDVGGWYTDASQTGTEGGAYTPLPPSRVLDTRLGIGGFSGAIGAGSQVDVQIAGAGGVPTTGVAAVILNVTVTQPAGAGFLTIFPAGQPRPNASDLNFALNEDRPNLVVVRLSEQLRAGDNAGCPVGGPCTGPTSYNVAGGKVSLFASNTTHVIFDVAGWYSTNHVPNP